MKTNRPAYRVDQALQLCCCCCYPFCFLLVFGIFDPGDSWGWTSGGEEDITVAEETEGKKEITIDQAVTEIL